MAMSDTQKIKLDGLVKKAIVGAFIKHIKQNIVYVPERVEIEKPKGEVNLK